MQADNRAYKSSRDDVVKRLVRSGRPVIRGNIVGMVWGGGMGEREMWVTDEGIRCDGDMMKMMVQECAEQAVKGQVLANFLAGEEEEPLEGQFNLYLDLLFNTVDHLLLDTFLGSDWWDHARVCEDIII